ncbi:MAG: hypothetical protein QXM43_05670 [Desulfurococcaceae archaeon]
MSYGHVFELRNRVESLFKPVFLRVHRVNGLIVLRGKSFELRGATWSFECAWYVDDRGVLVSVQRKVDEEKGPVYNVLVKTPDDPDAVRQALDALHAIHGAFEHSTSRVVRVKPGSALLEMKRLLRAKVPRRAEFIYRVEADKPRIKGSVLAGFAAYAPTATVVAVLSRSREGSRMLVRVIEENKRRTREVASRVFGALDVMSRIVDKQ